MAQRLLLSMSSPRLEDHGSLHLKSPVAWYCRNYAIVVVIVRSHSVYVVQLTVDQK